MSQRRQYVNIRWRHSPPRTVTKQGDALEVDFSDIFRAPSGGSLPAEDQNRVISFSCNPWLDPFDPAVLR